MKSLFFPNIARASTYKVKQCGSYYHYSTYRAQVHADCQDRCVYCDVMLEENGHEGFALDHLKPQDLFPKLRDIPENLVIACGKCNRHKSSHWPVGADGADTHNGTVGFLDPFQCDRHQYFHIEDTGAFAPIKGPSLYLIELLNLNRPSRLLVRKHRMLIRKIDTLIDLAQKCIEEAVELLEEEHSKEEVHNKLKLAKEAIQGIRTIRQQISAIR